MIVRVGRARKGKSLGYSLDGGKTWREPAPVPDAKASEGHIAVSSDGDTWVWTPREQAPYVTKNKGATWAACEGLPKETRVVADRLNPRRFYAIALFDGKLFESIDGAANFTERPLYCRADCPSAAALATTTAPIVATTAAGKTGSTPCPAAKATYGWRLTRASTTRPTAKRSSHARVERLHAFGFGRAAPGTKMAALYLVGTARAAWFLPLDRRGATWLRINDDQHQWGLVLQITGDPKKFGRVYVGTHGRGTFYGDPKTR